MHTPNMSSGLIHILSTSLHRFYSHIGHVCALCERTDAAHEVEIPQYETGLGGKVYLCDICQNEQSSILLSWRQHDICYACDLPYKVDTNELLKRRAQQTEEKHLCPKCIINAQGDYDYSLYVATRYKPHFYTCADCEQAKQVSVDLTLQYKGLSLPHRCDECIFKSVFIDIYTSGNMWVGIMRDPRTNLFRYITFNFTVNNEYFGSKKVLTSKEYDSIFECAFAYKNLLLRLEKDEERL